MVYNKLNLNDQGALVPPTRETSEVAAFSKILYLVHDGRILK